MGKVKTLAVTSALLVGVAAASTGGEAVVEHFGRADAQACLAYDDGSKLGQCLETNNGMNTATGMLEFLFYLSDVGAIVLATLALKEAGIIRMPSN